MNGFIQIKRYPILDLPELILSVKDFKINCSINEHTKYSIIGSLRLSSIPIEIHSETDSKFVSRGEAILDSLKSWNKILRGKKPIYITSGGSQISVDPIGDEKAIKLFKRF